LTATGSTELFLRLFVAADETAHHPLLETVFTGEILFTAQSDAVFQDGDIPPLLLALLTGTRGRLTGHSDAVRLLPDRYFLTRLEGTLSRQDMRHDLAPSFGGKTLFVKRAYTPGAALTKVARRGFLLGLAVSTLAPAVGWLLTRNRPAPTSLLWILGLALVLLTGGLHYARLPVVEPASLTPWFALSDWESAADTLSHQRLPSGLSDQDLWLIIKDRLSQAPRVDDLAGYPVPHVDFTNPLTDKPRQLREYPGDCQIERLDGRTFLTFYSAYCVPYRVPLSFHPPPSSQPTN